MEDELDKYSESLKDAQEKLEQAEKKAADVSEGGFCLPFTVVSQCRSAALEPLNFTHPRSRTMALN